MQTRSVALVLFVLAACGNNSGNGNGDGGNGGDGGSNGPDAFVACDYTESMDGTNATTPEATGVTIGAQNKTLCGQVDTGHFGSATQTVDVDEYSVAVGGTAELVVEFEDSTPTSLTDFNVTITDAAVDPTILNSGDFTGAFSDHGAYLAELPAGNFNIVVTATSSAAISAAIPYKVRIVADQPTTRCPDMTTATADYTEANDGASNIGNDVITVDFTKPTSFALTTATTDNPETSGITLDATTNKHIAGSSGMPSPAYTDKYVDRDTFAFMTGTSTNEMSIRLDWPGTTSDLDYLVFENNVITAPVAVATLTANSQDEFQTFAVKPNTSYWLWVGAYAGSTGQPIAYSASLCGATFTP
jgi:hypothetical protein